jgi:hypothetical protein
MTTWTSDELDKIGAAEELHIASLRRDGTLRKPVIVWVVSAGGGLYVRSAYGPDAAWYRGIQLRREGWVEAGGVEKDVAFEDVDPTEQDEIDAAYRSKYHRHGAQYVDSVTNAVARPTTIRFVPR